jgi:uncharacterized oxidoreductase
MPIIQVDALRAFITDIFEATGAPRAEAAIVGEHLVEANLMGHDSHGIVRTLGYVNQTKTGALVPAAPVEVSGGRGGAAVVDVHWNFGQVGATRAMEVAIERAREFGLGAAVCRNCGHIGRVGAYGELAAAAGMIGMACVNNPGTEGLVAPFGGAKGRMGTNPWSVVIPTTDPTRPFVLDFATSVAAEGKVRVARNKGVEMPPDYLIDSAGRPTRNPADLYLNEAGERGALLPFGGPVGYKAYGLAMAVEALSGALSGSGTAGSGKLGGNGVFMLAMDVSAFIDRGEFDGSFSGLVEHVTQPPYREGYEEILTAGDPERRRMAQRLADGIDVDEETWRQVCEAGAVVGVEALGV